ncbi:uncharacterized protein PV09_04686 [Verruconis gallopava]|uniref:Uncharacterized protein n=1 Tax=Verruconis gallopava TaxID=253628 RepID=A0A0D2AD88_9PEZI|nr:uncharacterized protein PV09_04686 [Verruconis gallopava]KIW04410.1 hypothetical protein PV09_04686 [Verruconis gallopava]
MPFRAQKSLLNLDEKSIEAIDTRNVIDLHGLWSVFHKCADALENGKRLENLSWRLFSREAFCCAPDLSLPSDRGLHSKRNTTSSLDRVPDLSSSVDSHSSSEGLESSSRALPTSARPELIRKAVMEGGARKEKHITPVDLEKIVVSIKSRQDLAPLSPLPPALVPSAPAVHTTHETAQHEQVSKPDSTPQPDVAPAKATSQYVLDSSTSTVATDGFSDMSPPLAGSETTGTDVSATSIVRGFSKDHISCSARSHSQLLPTPTPSGSILKNSATYRSQAPQQPKKKGATFHLGSSSGEFESSFESSYMHGRSSLSEGLRRSKKTTSFNDQVSTLEDESRPKYQDTAVFDDSDEDDDEEQSSSAIEEDDGEDDWEDDDEQSASSSVQERELFQRVDSKPNLVSRRSLLTSMMHEKDRAAALQNAASRSTPAIRRSRTTSPNGPLNSSQHTSITQGLEASRARPIVMTASNTHPPALSPRTTRRNMLSTELTESLRKHILWDRQVNRSTTNAALKRRHTAQDMTKIRHFPGENHPQTFMASKVPQSVKSSWNNNYFDSGLQEYHQKGW